MEELIKIIADTLRINSSQINEFTKITDVPEWDSLSHMTLISVLEEKYKIQFRR